MSAKHLGVMIAFAGLILLTACGQKQAANPLAASASTAVPGKITLGENSLQLKQLKVETVVATEVPASSVVAPRKARSESQSRVACGPAGGGARGVGPGEAG